MTPNQKTTYHDLPKRKTVRALAFLLALSSGAGLAPAQTVAESAVPTPEEVVQLEEFTVVGQRASAMKAIEVKKNNIQFTDSIVSEDIGKFPDNNVVEALQRVPGIQVTDYSHGNITGVSIRGLPDTTTLLNGRNIFTASGTSLSLSDFPASLVSRVDVMKTRSASMIESGMAGVIDIRTFRPFDFPGSKININAKTTYQETADKFDPNVSALASNVWKFGSEGKVGILINASYLTTSYRDQSATSGAQVPFTSGIQSDYSSLPYDRIWSGWSAGLINGLSTTPGSKIAGTNIEYVLSRDAVFFNETTGKTKRPAANLSLQFAPDKNSEYTFEVFYSGYRNENFSNLLFSYVDWWAAPTDATYDVTLFPGTNIVNSRGYIGGVSSFTSADYSQGRTDSFQYSLQGLWHITPSFNVRSEVVHQNSKYTGENFFIRADRNVTNNVSVNFNTGDGSPSLTYLDVAGTAVNEGNIADAATWNIGTLYDQGYENKGYSTTLTEEGDLSVDWGWIKKLKFGLYLDDRKASQASRMAEASPYSATDLATLNTLYPGIVSINSDFFDGRADVPSTWAAINGSFIGANKDEIRKLYLFSTNNDWFDMKETFSVDELTTAAYVQADEVRTNIAGHTLTGQFGARLVSIKTLMTSTSTVFGNYDKTKGHAGVTKILPSAAFNFEFTKQFIARVGYGETLRRPAFSDLNPKITYTRDSTNIGYGTATGGNVNLKPTTSKSFDFALEYYFDEGSMIHAAYFKKKIDGLVVSSYRRVRYDDGDGDYDYILSQPMNGSNGKLDGVELGAKYYPKNLPAWLQGIGVEGSYTHLKSSQDVPLFDSTTGEVIGTQNNEFYLVSPNSYNLTLGYERSKFSARASYAWRSAFHHHNEAASFANPLYVYNSAQRSLTAQVSYKITDNMSVDIEGTNLTNDIQYSYYGEDGSVTNSFGSWIIGRTISAGVRYSF